MNAAFAKQFVCIVGAPRCGTTSLATFLSLRPEVCFSKVKEPHFFSARDLRGLSCEQLREAIEEDYLARYFPHCSDQHEIIAEGSVSYLYAPDMLEPLLRLWPQAKFIIAVRDPFELLPSLHGRLLYQGDESVSDFGKAWDLRERRMRGEEIPRSCIDPRFLQYEEIGRLGKHVKAFIDLVGRERCFISVYDDLVNQPEALYRRLLSFLDLPQNGRIEVSTSRSAKGFKIGWLQRLLKRPPRWTRRVLAGTKFRYRVAGPRSGPPSSPVSKIFALRGALLRWNKAPAPEVTLSPRIRSELNRKLGADIHQLSLTLERDLSHWLGGLPAIAADTERRKPQPAMRPPLDPFPSEEQPHK